MNKEQLKEKIAGRYAGRCEILDHSPRRIYVTIDKKEARDVASFFFQELGARLSICTGLETSHNFEFLYHFSFDEIGLTVTVRAILGKANPEIESIKDIIPAAEWIEYENNELLGIDFIGNPRKRRFILAEDWPDGVYPLRKNGEEHNG
ncbi:MAG: NADH-quinone oxidoreductase subunit C [Candidatus Saganbacteria bacterium]|nr:NADH-quinone oxidoreductase subunit C [Candidatus Saganbacteria bacterium]